jgi:AraC-like DNA-binding protein
MAVRNYSSDVRYHDPPALYQGFPMLGSSRAQVWAYSPRYRRPRHFHAEPELNLVVSGTAVFGVGEKRVTVQAGEFLSFAPGQDHVLEVGSPELMLFALGLRSEYSERVLGEWQPPVVTSTPVRLPREVFQELTCRVEACTEQEGLDSKIAELWERVRYVHDRSSTGSSTPHVLTRRTLSALLAEPALDRDALARRARGNPTELSRHFHRDLGMTLVQYRTRLRLLDFIRNVDRGMSNLTSASVSAGFGSYSQCHRQFSEQLGSAPRDFFRNGVRSQMEQAFLPVDSTPTRA